MVYRKRVARKRYPRRRYSRRPTKAFTSKVLKVVKRTQEKKYYPYANSGTVGSTGYLLDLTTIPQGDTDTSRDGDALRVTSIQINFAWAAADAYNICRMVMFQWMPASSPGSPPALSDIFVDTADAVISPFAHDTRKSYRILADKTCIVDTDDPMKICKMYVYRKFMRNIQYSGGTTTGTGNIYCWLVTDSNVSTHPAVSWSGKTNFTDS